MMTFQDIVKRIRSLPPLSNIVFEVLRLYDAGVQNVNMIRLIRLIEKDATLTANVLKYVNDPKFGFSKKISSVSQAVTLLGSEIIYGIIVEYSIEQKLSVDTIAYGMTQEQFNEMCHLQSALLLQWYSLIDPRDAQFLTPLALIMEAGKLIIAKEVAQSDYARQFRRGLEKMQNVEAYEYELLDTTSYYVSALLFEHWNLEETFIEILKNLDFEVDGSSQKVLYFADIIDVIRTAINVRSVLTTGSIAKAAQKVKEIGLSETTFLHVANRVKKTYENI